MNIIETSLLTRRFGNLTAVDRLDLSVAAGEAFGLLGPNGAGKTTVVKMLTTLIPPTSGRATVAGFDVQRQARIAAALEFVGLEEAAHRQVRGYSGGMMRRLEIALAILHRPRVLFLDEPTVGLDPLARQAVWQHLRLLGQEYKMTIFLTTHFMEEADNLCGRVAIMNLGRVAALGRPEDLKVSIGRPDAPLDEVFAHYTGHELDNGGNYREISRSRRTAARLG